MHAASVLKIENMQFFKKKPPQRRKESRKKKVGRTRRSQSLHSLHARASPPLNINYLDITASRPSLLSFFPSTLEKIFSKFK